MIFAAGYGTRMRPLTDKTPKPLLKVAGKPLLEYHLEKLRDAGFSEVIINVSHLGEQIESAFGDGARWNLAISYSREVSPLETAGGLRHAQTLLGADPFLIVNGDVWCDIEFTELPRTINQIAHLIMVPNSEHHPKGDFGFASGEHGLMNEAADHCFTYSGISIISPQLLNLDQKQEKLGQLFRLAMQQGLVTGELYHGDWVDVGTPERLRELDQRIRQIERC